METKTFETKKDYIVKALREKILSGLYQPGVRLKTKDLAHEFGTSEIPVREAINQLSSAGLVEVIPHVGATTTRISSRDLQEIFQIRTELESLATRLSAPQLSSSDLRALENIQAMLEQAVEDGSPPAVLNAMNREFHMYLYRKSGNRRLVAIIDDLWNHAGRYPAPLTGHDDNTAQSLQDHRGILACLQAGDLDGATLLTEQHKQRSFERILSQVRHTESS